MADLAAELGIAAGGVYHYFGGKESLLRRICLQLTEPLHPRARAALEGHDDPADRLRALVDVWVAHVVEHRDHMLVFQQERHVIESGAAWRDVRTQPQALRGAGRRGARRPGGRPAGPVRRPAHRAVRAAGHGEPHRPVVPAARAACRRGGRRRLRRRCSSWSALARERLRHRRQDVEDALGVRCGELAQRAVLPGERDADHEGRAAARPAGARRHAALLQRPATGPVARFSRTAWTWSRTASVSSGLTSARDIGVLRCWSGLLSHASTSARGLGGGPRAPSRASVARYSPSLLPKYRATSAGSTPASSPISRSVAPS